MIKLFTRKANNHDRNNRDTERAYWRERREEARCREREQRAAMLAEKRQRLYSALVAMQAARAEFEALAEMGAVDVDTAREAWGTLLSVEQWVAEEVDA